MWNENKTYGALFSGGGEDWLLEVAFSDPVVDVRFIRMRN